MNINWYPGHMAKAKKLIGDNLKLVDIVLEIRDARIPLSSTNPDFESMIRDKTRIVILNKSDFADPQKTQEWVNWFLHKDIKASPVNSHDKGDIKRIKRVILDTAALQRKQVKEAKGINKIIRAMVVGIPNVGKSTFINSLAGGGKAKTGDKPGVTKGKQWVRINPYLELLDTPGLLWPKLDDDTTALHLAFTRSIKEEVLDLEEIAHHFLEKARDNFPEAIKSRYGLEKIEGRGYEILEEICIRRGWIVAGGRPDIGRGARQVMVEFQTGKLGRITLETPPI